jgi:uncharacterized protein
VITETCHLLLHRLSYHAQTAFVQSYALNAFEIFDLSREQALKISSLMEQYRDLPMDLADASLVILAEHLGHGRMLYRS